MRPSDYDIDQRKPSHWAEASIHCQTIAAKETAEANPIATASSTNLDRASLSAASVTTVRADHVMVRVTWLHSARRKGGYGNAQEIGSPYDVLLLVIVTGAHNRAVNMDWSPQLTVKWHRPRSTEAL